MQNTGIDFWKRIDSLVPQDRTLKEVLTAVGLDYEIIKVQRHLNRIPRSEEACQIATALDVPVEWLVLGRTENILSSVRIGKTEDEQRLCRLFKTIATAPTQVWTMIENMLKPSTDNFDSRY